MKFLVTLGVVLGSTVVAHAQDWAPLDARSRALGGAGVAFADGRCDSMYWNPASLAYGSEKPLDFSTGWGFSLSTFAGVHAVGDIVGNLNHSIDLYKNGGTSGKGVQAIIADFGAGNGTDAEAQDVARLLDSILKISQPGEGVLVDLGVGLNIRVGPFGLFVRGIANAGGDPFSDFSKGSALSPNGPGFLNTAPLTPPTGGELASPGVGPLSTAMQGAGLSASQANILAVEALRSGVNIQDPRFFAAMVQIAGQTAANTIPNTQLTLDKNGSGIEVRALAQVEAGIGFGLPLLPTLLDVGIAIKMIYNEASFASQSVGQLTGKSLQTVVDTFKNNRKASSDFNIDLGARFMPLEWLTLSLSARNLIPMDIPVGGFVGGFFHQDPLVRFGAMGMALGFIRVGMDIDLLQQSSFDLSGYSVRRFGTGVEFDLPALIGFPLMIIPRVGYTDNLAMSSESGWITGGLAFKIFAFTLDLGAQMALDQAQYKAASSSGAAAKSYPAGGSVGVTLAVDLPF